LHLGTHFQHHLKERLLDALIKAQNAIKEIIRLNAKQKNRNNAKFIRFAGRWPNVAICWPQFLLHFVRVSSKEMCEVNRKPHRQFESDLDMA